MVHVHIGPGVSKKMLYCRDEDNFQVLIDETFKSVLVKNRLLGRLLCRFRVVLKTHLSTYVFMCKTRESASRVIDSIVFSSKT